MNGSINSTYSVTILGLSLDSGGITPGADDMGKLIMVLRPPAGAGFYDTVRPCPKCPSVTL